MFRGGRGGGGGRGRGRGGGGRGWGQGGNRATSPRGGVCRARQRGRAVYSKQRAGQGSVQREAHRRGRSRRARRRDVQGGVPRVEPVPLQAGGGDPGRRRPHPHAPGGQGALPRRGRGDHGVPRERYRGAAGVRVRRGVCTPPGPRPYQHGQVPNQRDSHHRGRTPPAQVPNAGGHGGLRVCRRGAARSGPHRVSQLGLLPEEWRALRNLHQGLLHRLHGHPGGCVRTRGVKAEGGAVQARGTAHAGAVREGPRRRGGGVPPPEEGQEVCLTLLRQTVLA